eukprot:m.196969 g.196969  ORF g.196969 m.196969 type:complete len:410 (+) comp32641_c1_seq1:161-1390(+)
MLKKVKMKTLNPVSIVWIFVVMINIGFANSSSKHSPTPSPSPLEPTISISQSVSPTSSPSTSPAVSLSTVRVHSAPSASPITSSSLSRSTSPTSAPFTPSTSPTVSPTMSPTPPTTPLTTPPTATSLSPSTVSPTVSPSIPETVTCIYDKKMCERDYLAGTAKNFFYNCVPNALQQLWDKCDCRCIMPTVAPTSHPIVTPTTRPTIAPTDCDNSKILLDTTLMLLDSKDAKIETDAFNANSSKDQCSSLHQGLKTVLSLLNTQEKWNEMCCGEVFHVIKDNPRTMNESSFLGCEFCQAPTVVTTTTMMTVTMTTTTTPTTTTSTVPTSANVTQVLSKSDPVDSESSETPDMSMMLILLVAAALCVVGFSYREKIQQKLGWSASSLTSRVYSRTRSSNTAAYSAVEREVY